MTPNFHTLIPSIYSAVSASLRLCVSALRSCFSAKDLASLFFRENTRTDFRTRRITLGIVLTGPARNGLAVKAVLECLSPSAGRNREQCPTGDGGCAMKTNGMKRKTTGFTLIELLVVMAIIATLAALILPVLSKARETSRRTACSSQLSQIGKAFIMYEGVATNGAFPLAGAPGTAPSAANTQNSLGLIYSSYVDDPKIFKCPSAKTPSTALLLDIKPVKPGDLNFAGSLGSPTNSSYAYDPGHSSQDMSSVVVAADAMGANAADGSDNHGAKNGQNVLTVGGSVEFRNTVKNTMGKNVDDVKIVDDNIYLSGGGTGLAPGLDSHLRNQ